MAAEDVDVLLSLQIEYLDKILAGTKTVELRRRALRVPIGTRVWLYAKSPTASVCAYTKIEAITVARPTQLWASFQDEIGIDKCNFDKYFAGRKIGCALTLGPVYLLRRPIALYEIRKAVGAFQPPQFAKHLRFGSPELKLFRRFEYA